MTMPTRQTISSTDPDVAMPSDDMPAAPSKAAGSAFETMLSELRASPVRGEGAPL